MLAAHDLKRSLEDIVSELIVDELLHDEAHSLLQVLGLLSLVAEFLDDLEVIIREGSLEDLINVGLIGLAVFAAHF